MKIIHEYTTVDKSDWGDGPWQSEPDKVQMVDEETGYDCLMVRNHYSGSWCGYVGVRKSNDFYEKHYDECKVGDEYLEVHCGLTFSGHCSESEDESRGICHVPINGSEDKVWWLGFDCSHSGDLWPKHRADMRKIYEMRGEMIPRYYDQTSGDIYRDREYVVAQIKSLANQLKEVEHEVA